MLYDPRWEVEIKADPFSLESLIAWLEKQPADGVYCYSNAGHCLAAQYHQHIGENYFPVCIWNSKRDFKTELERIAFQRPHTFGGALERARSARDNL